MNDMKRSGVNRCLLVATSALVAALSPLAGGAQETPAGEPAAAPPIPQQRYVSDKLVLNVYVAADQSGGRVATIQTGDSVEELERAGNMVHVRLEDGREGWVGANYLTGDPPAVVRLRELQRQQTTGTCGPDKKSLDEIALLKKNNATLQTRVAELQARTATPIAPAASAAECEQIMAPESSDGMSEDGASISSPSPLMSWVWTIAALAVGGALGFASGYQSLARRLRKKFGGLKVY